MPIHYKFSPAEKDLTISISDEFDFTLHAKFRETYRDISPDKVSTVSVNLSHATYMDSSALGMLLLLTEHFDGTQISLEQCPDFIQSVLKTANFEKKFKIS